MPLQNNRLRRGLLVTIGFLIGCAPVAHPPAAATPPPAALQAAFATAASTSTPPRLTVPPASPTPLPTATATPTPPPDGRPAVLLPPRRPLQAARTPSAPPQADVALWPDTPTPAPTVPPTATYWPTVTRQLLPPAVAAGLVPCASRSVDTGLLTFVSQQFGLPPGWAPGDLAPLAESLGEEVLRGQALQLRLPAVVPLQRLLAEMQAAGLHPSVLSAYRSYDEQALAWHWWSGKYPDRAAIMSARPGYSEHQLGTAVDFGSPALNHLFHVDFGQTAEGVWLAANAHRFGFTMSYPAHARPVTGFKYEPWHFRYVGVDMAGRLRDAGQFLLEWQLANLPPPCIP